MPRQPGTKSDASHRAHAWRLATRVRLQSILTFLPLILAFIAVTAILGQPNKTLAIISMLGMALHGFLITTHREQSRGVTTAHDLDSKEASQVQLALTELRQLHTSQSYLLGALKIHLSDERAKALAADAEDTARDAQYRVEFIARAIGSENKPPLPAND